MSQHSFSRFPNLFMPSLIVFSSTQEKLSRNVFMFCLLT
jgi:hypothetical protein